MLRARKRKREKER